jgi:hypothetical protein
MPPFFESKLVRREPAEDQKNVKHASSRHQTRKVAHEVARMWRRSQVSHCAAVVYAKNDQQQRHQRINRICALRIA